MSGVRLLNLSIKRKHILPEHMYFAPKTSLQETQLSLGKVDHTRLCPKAGVQLSVTTKKRLGIPRDDYSFIHAMLHTRR